MKKKTQTQITLTIYYWNIYIYNKHIASINHYSFNYISLFSARVQQYNYITFVYIRLKLKSEAGCNRIYYLA